LFNRRHAGVSPTNISFIHNDQHASGLLSIPARLLPSYGSGDEQQIHLCRQLVDLTKQIRTLNADLPLKIASIVGLDETFRYTNVFPPLPASFVTDLHKIRSIEHETLALIPRSTSRYAPPYSPSLLILCQLEMTSSNDPGFETVERIKHSKILFYRQLAKLLQSKFHYPCRATADCCYIEKENYIYRLIISYHKEIYLMESDAGKKEGLERTLPQTNLSRKLRYQIEYLPKINAAIYG
jgi:Nrap protein nucleotidyltransferase domain 4